MDKVLGIDLSYWNRLTATQWDLLVQMGVRFVIVRLGFGMNPDSMAATHVADAKAHGMVVHGYHWSDPLINPVSQADFFKSLVIKHGVTGAWGDFEQYWSDWAAFERGDWAAVYASRLSPATLDTFYHTNAARCKAVMPVPYGIYTAQYVVKDYSPQMGLWLGDYRLWIANYVKYFNVWIALLKSLGLNYPLSYMADKMLPALTNPWMPAGTTQWKIWQFITSTSFKGLPTQLDFNATYDAATFTEIFGEQLPPPPPPPGDVLSQYKVVKCGWLTVRVDPVNSSKAVKWLLLGTIVKVIGWNTAKTWAQIDSGWVSAYYLEAVNNSI